MPNTTNLTCTKCGHEGPPDDFPIDRRNRSGRSSNCRACARSATTRWKNTSGGRERVRAHQRAWHHAHRDERLEKQRDQRLRRRYGITAAEYDAMVEEVEGTCPICGCSDRPLVVDHDHDTGEVRGLLCQRCNLRVGIVEEGDWLAAALTYLGRV